MYKGISYICKGNFRDERANAMKIMKLKKIRFKPNYYRDELFIDISNWKLTRRLFAKSFGEIILEFILILF